ncbi:MAG TPA: DUF2905 domain-containing protein [Cytophagales bacterium]|jgi:hypothetical protein|nr:DUF2905 domain-containing protein [Cytophagales bacterium]
MPEKSIARLFIVIGLVLLVAGLLIYFGGWSKFFGRLPGDIVIKKKQFTFYFPLATSLIISIIFSLIIFIISKLR